MVPSHIIFFNDNHDIKRRTSGAYKMANQMQQLGWNTTVVDWVSDWSEAQLNEYLDIIVTNNTKVFAISYTWMNSEWVCNFVAKLKARYPGRKFIAGGQQFFQTDIGVDLCMYGYAELAINHAIEWLFNNGTELKFTRPMHLGGAALVNCNTDYKAANLDSYSIEYSPDDYIQPFELLTVEISRGCKFTCKYCDYAFIGIKEDTSTEYELLRAELVKNYTQWGTINYIIADDTLNDRTSKLEMLADVVESLPFQPNFSSFIRIDLVAANPGQMKLLSRARVWAHFYGVETFNEHAGKAVGKGMHPDKIKRALLDMREHMMREVGFYRGTLGMIAGLPHESPDSWQQSQDWLEANWSDNSWTWWPLEISTDPLTSSAFSKDWRKYGYRELEDSDRKKQITLSRNNGLKNKYDTNSFMWSSDWADVTQAIDFVNQWKASDFFQNRQVISNFELLNHWKTDGTAKEILNFTTKTNYSQITNQYNKIIKPYIEHKIANANRHITNNTQPTTTNSYSTKKTLNQMTKSIWPIIVQPS